MSNQEPQMNDPSHKNETAPFWLKTESPAVAYHITAYRVPLFEVDMGQAVYHGNYYHFFELGRSELLRKIGYPYIELINRQLHLSIVESRCKYRKALRYNDEIEIHTGIVSLSKRGLIFSQLIYRNANEASACQMPDKPEPELCTAARLNMLCVSFAGRVTPLPEDFLPAVEAFINKPVGL
jgi:acyl-CoA thioester hydrolase